MGAKIINRRPAVLRNRRNASDFTPITSPGELSYPEARNLLSLLHHLGIVAELRRDGEVVAVASSSWRKADHFYRQAVIDGLVKQQTVSNRGRRRNAEDPNESVQDRSHREWRENFNRVSADPEDATNTDLSRAIGFLDHMRRHIIRRAQEEGRKVDANVLAGYDNEQDYYISILRRREQRRAS